MTIRTPYFCTQDKPLVYALFLLLLFGTAQVCTAQEQKSYNLNDIIYLAQSEAPDVLLAQTRLNNSYWQYQSFLADFRPQIDLEVNSSLRRSVDIIDQPDGKPLFVSRAFVDNTGGISIQQDIAATGGAIRANTNLRRLDGLQSGNVDDFTSYLYSPISLEIQQPLFAFNRLKWSKRIEPLRYEQSKLQYIERMEQIALEAVSNYFDLLSAQLNYEAAKRERIQADTLLALSKGRFSVGRIAETDLLQIELRAMTASAALAQAQLTLESANENLRNFLGITQPIQFQLVAPTSLPEFSIDIDTVLNYAKTNRSISLAFQERLINADLEVAQARAGASPSMNLFGSFGLQSNADEFDLITENFQEAQVISLGLQVPLADWGKNRSRLEIARSRQDLERMNVNQERVNFEQQLRLSLKQIKLQRDQVALAERVYEVSQKRYDITQKRYLIGKIGVLDLNTAINDQENARRAYVGALQTFWVAYYELRNQTLYDFERQQPIGREVPTFD